MNKILLSLLSLVMITVMAGCSAPEGGTTPGQERRDQDAAEPAGDLPAIEAPAEPAPAPEATPAPEAAPADGAAPEAAPAPSASAAPLTGTTWA